MPLNPFFAIQEIRKRSSNRKLIPDFSHCNLETPYETMESSGADWSEASELELEEMLLSTLLYSIFRAAITAFVSHGYPDKDAIGVVLSAGSSYSCKDDVSTLENEELSRYLMTGEFGDYPPELKVHDELKKKKMRSVLKQIVDDVIRKADKPMSRGEVLWRLLLLDLDVGCASSRNDGSLNLEKSGTSSTSQIKPQLDLKSLLSAIDEQIAENSSTQQSRTGKEKRSSVLQNALEDLLLPMKCMLEKELEGWNDWAGQKVMQAAERLNKFKEELRLLRLQRQNRQFMKELTRQHVFLKAGNIALAKGLNDQAHIMETLNDQLRMELKDAKLHAAEVEENCKIASRRMEETLEKLQSSEEEKLLLLDELAVEKHHFDQLQRQFEQAKDLHDNTKVNLRIYCFNILTCNSVCCINVVLKIYINFN